MRALLTTTLGGPGRVATTAAAIVAIMAVATGHGWDVLRAVCVTSLAASAFALLFGVLAMVAAATGVCDDQRNPAPKEADRG